MKVYQDQRTGLWHQARGGDCQDAVLYSEKGAYALAAAADGVSACEKGGAGAALACRAFADFAGREGEKLFESPPEVLAERLLDHVRGALELAAAVDGREASDYASTLAAACVDRSTGRTVLLNLGDGAIFSLQGGQLRLLAAPRRFGGMPCVTTTRDACQAVQIRYLDLDIGDSLLLCTDGFVHAAGLYPQCRTIIRNAVREHAYGPLNTMLENAREKDDCSYLVMTRTQK